MGRLLTINSVIIHKYSSILSAYGMDLAEVTDEQQAPASESYTISSLERLMNRAEALKTKVQDNLSSQGIPRALIETEIFLSMRFQGTDTNLMIQRPDDGDFASVFKTAFKREFTYLPSDRDILVDAIRVRGRSKTQLSAELTPFEELNALRTGALPRCVPVAVKTTSVYFKSLGWTNTPVYLLNELKAGSHIPVSSF